MIATSSLGPTLETGRLILRPPVAEDFDGFCAFFADAEAMKHLGGAQTPPMVWRMLTSVAGAWHLYGFHMFSVLEKQTGAWIGRIGPLQPFGWPGREVGWGLMTAHQGKGYAGKLMTILAREIVADGKMPILHVKTENASAKHLYAKLGFRVRKPMRFNVIRPR